MSEMICGRAYVAVKSVDLHPPKTFFMESIPDGEGGQKKRKRERKSFYVKPKTKFIVEGIFHKSGALPIRFKSLQKAENYLKNFGLTRD